MARRFGSAMISKTDSTLCIYPTRHMRVKAYIKKLQERTPEGRTSGQTSALRWPACFLVAALKGKGAEFGKLGEDSQSFEADAIGFGQFRLCRVLGGSCFLVGEKIGDIDGDGDIKTGVGDAGGLVVMSDGFDGEVGEAPGSEQVGAVFRVRGSEKFLFGFEGFALALGGEGLGGAELVGHFAGQDEGTDIVKESGDNGDVAGFGVDGEA